MTLAGEQGETDYESDPAEVVLQIADEVPPEHRDAISPFSGFSAAWARLDGQVISLTADRTD